MPALSPPNPVSLGQGAAAKEPDTSPVYRERARGAGRSPRSAIRPAPRLPLTVALAALVVSASFLSLTLGAAGLGPAELLHAALGQGLSPRDKVVLYDIRLPRLALGLTVGASLAVSGVLLQGLFRNPLADPGIVGVSAGAGFGAVVALVLGGLLPLGSVLNRDSHFVGLMIHCR